MYLKNYLIGLNLKKIDFYVDMDGVIADYPFIDGVRYDNKRPLYTSIKKLEEISQMPNLTIHVLSVTRTDKGIKEKNEWLNKYAPFFEQENRNILSREANDMKTANELKTEFIKNIANTTESSIFFIDDDPAVYRSITKASPNVYMLKDSALID